METIVDSIRVMRFPLALAGAQFGRVVTLIRMASGEVVVHSTGPFSRDDVAGIASFGRPGALVEATLFHDSFARQGRAMFPDIPYFAPPGFEPVAGVAAQSLLEPPASWRGELDVLPLEGMPRVCEHVFFHRPSRTLIVADLLFNIGSGATGWTRFFFRHFAGISNPPGMSRLFRLCIRDREGFVRSLQTMMDWDFDRVIFAHGDIIESGGKARLTEALRSFFLTKLSFA